MKAVIGGFQVDLGSPSEQGAQLAGAGNAAYVAPDPFCVPIPFSEIASRIGLAGPRVPATESIRIASLQTQIIEDHRPIAESLECRLALLHWARQGILPFIEGAVPFVVNNNGRLSENAAALLFESCLETGPRDGRIAVLELGAGTGLFAHYFLDEFRRLCERESLDFYRRLTYYATDISPRTVEQWAERGIFREHAGHVIAAVCDGSSAPQIGLVEIRAAFCNYALDVLPSAIVRRTSQGWEQIAVRTSIRDDDKLLRSYTSLTFDKIRKLAASPDPEAQAGLLPLLPILEIEGAFQAVGDPAPHGLMNVECEPGGPPFAYNYGAIDCLEALLALLEPRGFLLVNDYRAPSGDTGATYTTAQRFGPATAMGLNFPLLDEHFARGGVTVLKPGGDDASPVHARLLFREASLSTRQAFEIRFAAAAREHADVPIEQARQEAAVGNLRQALARYRVAIDRNPRDWQLIGEAAEFVSTQLMDHTAGLELAREALQLNPWYSSSLWNVLGDCLASLQQPGDAHQCYLQAHRIHAGDAQTNLKLAESWLALGDPRRSLEAVARGLANDSNAMLRHVLLEKQQQAIASLAVRWNAEREIWVRRQA